jgi:hypothetical protein
MLTTSVDTLTGTANNDTFNGVVAANVAAGNSVQVADTINGGAGTDTLNITSDQEGAVPALTTTSVEIISIRTTDDDDNTGGTFNAANATGLTNLTLDRLTDDFAVTGLSTGVTTKIFDNTTGEDVSLTYASVTGKADTAKIEVDKLGTTNLVIADGIETVQLTSSGTKSTIAQLDHGANATALTIVSGVNLTITESDQGGDNTVKTITASGAGALTIGGELSTAVTTVNASASTGGVSLGLTNVAAAATITGGSGNDTLTAINTNANTISLGAGNDTVDLNAVVASSTGTIAGGEGTDTLVFGDASATLIVAGNKASFTGFEKMKSEVSTDTLDFEALSTFTSFEAGTATALTLNNLSTTAAEDVLVSGVQTTSMIVNIKNATDVGTSNTLKLTLDNTTADTAVTIADLQAAGLETLTVVSSGAGTNTNSIELGTETNVLSNVNISGASNFTLTVQNNANLTGQQTVDASSATGVVTVNLSGDSDGVSITGGSGNDIITSGTGNDILVGGAGADTFNAGDGTATITTGTSAGGHDIIQIADGDYIAANKLTVKDFTAGTDEFKIDDSTNILDAGAGDITNGLSAAEFQTATVGATNYTFGAGVLALELAFEFDADVDLDTATDTQIFTALGAANDSTASSVTAGQFTLQATGDALMLIAYQSGNAYMFSVKETGGDTILNAGGDGSIDLVGVLEGVAVGALSNVDFIA